MVPLIISDGSGQGCTKRNRNRAQFVNITKIGTRGKENYYKFYHANCSK